MVRHASQSLPLPQRRLPTLTALVDAQIIDPHAFRGLSAEVMILADGR